MWVIAHRGASAFAPENTLAAFRKAVEMGAQFIETDLHLSRDVRLVSIHDETLERTTNGSGAVSATTLKNLRELDAGSWFKPQHASETAQETFAGQRIPTIEEILAFGKDADIGMFLEIKAAGSIGAERALVGALKTADEVRRAVVLSFDPGSLSRVHAFDPLVVTGLLCSDVVRNAIEIAVSVGARQLLPRADRITPELVKAAHGSDLKVVVWTVNDAEEMKRTMAAGVDGIITDHPNVLCELLRVDSQASAPAGA